MDWIDFLSPAHPLPKCGGDTEALTILWKYLTRNLVKMLGDKIPIVLNSVMNLYISLGYNVSFFQKVNLGTESERSRWSQVVHGWVPASSLSRTLEKFEDPSKEIDPQL